MKNEPVNKHYGISMSEWIAKVPNELDVDAVGLWQIVPVGREDFGLSGTDLIEYVRRNLLALFAKGAKPVVPAHGGQSGWSIKTHYGDGPEEMAQSIISEWLSSGKDPEPNDSLWFALPDLGRGR